jgi:hypothetical protein
VKDRPDNKSRDNKYDKIRHLVEVDDDILTVFSINSMNSPDMKELYIAKNVNIDKNIVEKILFNHYTIKWCYFVILSLMDNGILVRSP